jgi:hypothetical protein
MPGRGRKLSSKLAKNHQSYSFHLFLSLLVSPHLLRRVIIASYTNNSTMSCQHDHQSATPVSEIATVSSSLSPLQVSSPSSHSWCQLPFLPLMPPKPPAKSPDHNWNSCAKWASPHSIPFFSMQPATMLRAEHELLFIFCNIISWWWAGPNWA